jgi:transposase, IS5 family
MKRIGDYEVYDQRPNDANLLIPAIEAHEAMLGRTPHLVAADAGLYSAKNEAAAKAKGAKRAAFSMAPSRALSANASKKSAGSAAARNGRLDARDASAWPSGGTGSTVGDIKVIRA